MFVRPRGGGQPRQSRANEVDCRWRSKVTSNYAHVPVMPAKRNWYAITKPFQRQESRVQFNPRINDTKQLVSIEDTRKAQKF